MRILMLAPRAPYPADHGTALRNLYLLKWLSRHHQISLLCFGHPNDPAVIRVLEEYARKVVVVPPPRRSLPRRLASLVMSSQPDLVQRLWSPGLIARLRELLEQSAFDLVQIEGLEMFGLWESASAGRQGLGPTVVLDEHNAEYALQATAWQVSWQAHAWIPAAYSLVQTRRLRRYEAHACRLAHGVVTVSTDDERAIRALYPAARTCVVPNGVDTSHYQAGARQTDGATVLFIGKLDYRPNLDALSWFCREIWPSVHRAIPRARLLVVGRDLPAAQVPLVGVPGVEIVGAVADERPWFDRADLLVVPMRMGSGVRLKVLQAMAMGVPVVSTSLGMAGVAAVSEVHYLHADTARDFAQRVCAGLADPERRQAISEAARRLVCAQYDWRVIVPRLDQFYAELTGIRDDH